MPRFHHVNLGVPGAALPAEGRFLVDVLGLTPAEVPDDLIGRARWFDFGEGAQVHLSEEVADFTPSRRGHVAVEVGDDLSALEARALAAGLSVEPSPRDPGIVFCTDPAGYRWELRGSR